MTVPAATLQNDANHYLALCQLHAPEQWAVKYLYDRLNIIDNKTSALLRFNGVALGFLAVLGSRLAESDALTAHIPPGPYLGGCFVILLWLSYAEYQAFRIFYLHFDRVTSDRTFEQYKQTFFQITCEREGRFRKALWASRIGGLLFVVLVSCLLLFNVHTDPFWAWVRHLR
jgi:hypothetical protein